MRLPRGTAVEGEVKSMLLPFLDLLDCSWSRRSLYSENAVKHSLSFTEDWDATWRARPKDGGAV